MKKKRIAKVEDVLSRVDAIADTEELNDIVNDIEGSLDSIRGQDDEIENETQAENEVTSLIKDLERGAKEAERLSKAMKAAAKEVRERRQAIVNKAVEDLVECPNCSHHFRAEDL